MSDRLARKPRLLEQSDRSRSVDLDDSRKGPEIRCGTFRILSGCFQRETLSEVTGLRDLYNLFIDGKIGVQYRFGPTPSRREKVLKVGPDLELNLELKVVLNAGLQRLLRGLPIDPLFIA
jgi:hypothetical protein